MIGWILGAVGLYALLRAIATGHVGRLMVRRAGYRAIRRWL